MKRIIIILFALSVTGSAFAGRYAGEFLELGIGPRQVAMAGAIATGSSATSFYWNPALLSNLNGIEVNAMYVPLFDGMAYYHVIGAAMPITGAAIGIHWVRLGVDDIPVWPDYSDAAGYTLAERQMIIRDRGGRPTGYATDREDAFFFTFAKLNRVVADFGWSYFSLPMEIPAGFNVKLISTELYNRKGTGLGVDAGVGLKFSMNDLLGMKRLGDFHSALVANDFTKTGINWGHGVEDAIPLNLRFGLGYTQPLPQYKSDITAEMNTEKRYEYYLNWGMEYTYDHRFSVRAGRRQGLLAYGAGIRFWKTQVDYAFQEPELGNQHWVGVSFHL